MHAKVFVGSTILRRANVRGVGVLLIVDGRVYEVSQPIGRATYRTALRTAIDFGLMEVLNRNVKIVDIYIPSRVVVDQLRRKEERNWSNTLALLKQFEYFTINFIMNRQNRAALALTRRAAELSLAQLSTT